MTVLEVEAPIRGVSKTDRKEEPRSFNELRKEELVALANHFGTNPEGTNKVIVVDLVDNGVTWEMAAETLGFSVNKDAKRGRKPVEKDEVKKEDIVTATEEVLKPSAKYLVKMERENPYFEWRSYKFPTEKPFAVMDANDAQEILSTEVGFRQAFPQELEEYYS